MRTVDPIALDALANQKGNPIIRVLTWTDIDAYDAAPTVPETTFLCNKFDIFPTSANAWLISPTNSYEDADFGVFIIERGVTVSGTEYPIQSGLYFLRSLEETPGRIQITGSTYPNKKIVIDGDDTYENIITAFCTEIGKTAVFKDDNYSWLDYQFLPTGKQIILNKAERFENLLRQKYTIQVYERSPKELVFYLASEEQSAWSDIIYANNQFVISATSGSYEINTSLDGKGWAKQSAASFTNALAYSPTLDLYVAVGNSVCITSPDGETWTSRTIGAYNWTAVTWSNGLFIATSSNGRFSISSNGTSWTYLSKYEQISKDFVALTWSPSLDLFVATRYQNIESSPDGETWTVRFTQSTTNINSVVWSEEQGLFVAVASSGTNRVMTSPNGIDWTARTAAEANSWVSVTYAPSLDLFVAVAFDGTNRVMTSPNGIDWTARTAAEANQWLSVTWSEELALFAAVSNTGTNRVMTSPNGINWTARSASASVQWYSICWSPDLEIFVAVANSADNSMWSDDGTTWHGNTGGANNVIWVADLSLFFSVTSSGYIKTSPDGATWTIDTNYTPSTTSSGDIAWSPELRVLLIQSDDLLLSKNTFDLSANSITYGNVFAAVGTSKCYTSTDGEVWTERAIPAGTYHKVIYANSVFVAVGASKCATSPDGETWTDRTIPAGTYYGLTYSEELDLFVAVGDGIVASSPSGTTWTAQTPPGTNNFKAIAWSSALSIFIAVSSDGNYRIITSINGTSWSFLTTTADFSLDYNGGTEFSIIHGISNVHYLWRDEASTTHTEGDLNDPMWNLGYLESTDSPPSVKTDPYYKFYLRKAPVRLDITDGDRLHFEPSWTLDPSKTIDAQVIISEHFDTEKPPTWWQDINSNAIFAGTEGGTLPSTIERASPYTPLTTSGFDGILDSSVNNLQALAERVDDHTH